MNSVCISGRITHAPELRHTQNRTPIVSFSVAVDRPGVRDKTDFIDCVAWRASAEFVGKYFAKGDPIELTGSITTRSYEDRGGNKRKAVEIICDRIGFPKQKKKAEDSAVYGGQFSREDEYYGQGFTEVDSDEALPF